jgi:predicted ester cyclase
MTQNPPPPAPSSLPVTDVPWQDASVLLNPGPEKRQPMQGFDERIVDIVDYHLRGTHWIWEERGVGRIYNQYGHNAPVWVPGGVVEDREGVIANTLQVQHTFPDRRLYTDDVIWRHEPDTEVYHFSAAFTNSGHHWGYGPWGPPTGKKLTWGVLCNCVASENRITEEWLIRDELAILQQLGRDPWELARSLVSEEAVPEGLSSLERSQGQQAPQVAPRRSGDFDLEDFLRAYLHDLWNVRLLNRVRECCAPNVRLRVQGNRRLYGTGDYVARITALLAQFPDAVFTVDDLYFVPDRLKRRQKASVRWTLQGTHEGWGPLGKPTGRRIRVMGLSHLYVKEEKIDEEFSLFSTVDLMRQLLT